MPSGACLGSVVLPALREARVANRRCRVPSDTLWRALRCLGPGCPPRPSCSSITRAPPARPLKARRCGSSEVCFFNRHLATCGPWRGSIYPPAKLRDAHREPRRPPALRRPSRPGERVVWSPGSATCTGCTRLRGEIRAAEFLKVAGKPRVLATLLSRAVLSGLAEDFRPPRGPQRMRMCACHSALCANHVLHEDFRRGQSAASLAEGRRGPPRGSSLRISERAPPSRADAGRPAVSRTNSACSWWSTKWAAAWARSICWPVHRSGDCSSIAPG